MLKVKTKQSDFISKRRMHARKGTTYVPETGIVDNVTQTVTLFHFQKLRKKTTQKKITVTRYIPGQIDGLRTAVKLQHTISSKVRSGEWIETAYTFPLARIAEYKQYKRHFMIVLKY